jgi:outer membrane protein OmpA-like peptidoglycan-associated protein
MKKNITLIFVILLSVITAQAQLGSRIGNAVKRSAENAVIRKAERETEKAVDKAIDDAINPKSKEEEKNEPKAQEEPQIKNNNQANEANHNDPPASNQKGKDEPKVVKSPEMAYNKFDFVAGDEIIFEDNLVGEKVGEFPSRWDLIEGEAEIAKMNGENIIVIGKDCWIRPLMKDMYNYLGDVYTIEFDYWFQMKKESGGTPGSYCLRLVPAKEKWHGYRKFEFNIPGYVDEFYWTRNHKNVTYRYYWNTTSDENAEGHREEVIEPESWVHISMSFNKRAMKIYVNENRIANIPNMKSDVDWLAFHYSYGDDQFHGCIKNFRIAKGAVPLYDRMMTDGKIISYGITFDVGKSAIKPESMGEINRIAEFMKENSDIKFSVEGHTDNTGNAASNQTLSDARSKAVLDKLVEMGIAADRLKSAGKGQTSPIADNGTDEGRAKNRRVEFVKIN